MDLQAAINFHVAKCDSLPPETVAKVTKKYWSGAGLVTVEESNAAIDELHILRDIKMAEEMASDFKSLDRVEQKRQSKLLKDTAIYQLKVLGSGTVRKDWFWAMIKLKTGCHHLFESLKNDKHQQLKVWINDDSFDAAEKALLKSAFDRIE